MQTRITDTTWSRLRVRTDDLVLFVLLEQEIRGGWHHNCQRRSRRVELATDVGEITIYYAGCRRHFAPIRTQLLMASQDLDVQILGSCAEGCRHAHFLPHPQTCLQCLVASLNRGDPTRLRMHR